LPETRRRAAARRRGAERGRPPRWRAPVDGPPRLWLPPKCDRPSRSRLRGTLHLGVGDGAVRAWRSSGSWRSRGCAAAAGAARGREVASTGRWSEATRSSCMRQAPPRRDGARPRSRSRPRASREGGRPVLSRRVRPSTSAGRPCLAVPDVVGDDATPGGWPALGGAPGTQRGVAASQRNTTARGDPSHHVMALPYTEAILRQTRGSAVAQARSKSRTRVAAATRRTATSSESARRRPFRERAVQRDRPRHVHPVRAAPGRGLGAPRPPEARLRARRPADLMEPSRPSFDASGRGPAGRVHVEHFCRSGARPRVSEGSDRRKCTARLRGVELAVGTGARPHELDLAGADQPPPPVESCARASLETYEGSPCRVAVRPEAGPGFSRRR